MAEGGGGRPRVRSVRCLRCDNLLPDLANFAAHRCGSRNATPRAKEDPSAKDSSPVSSYGAKPSYLNKSNESWNKKGVAFGPGSSTDGESIGLDLRKEEETLGISPEAPSGRKFLSRIDDKVDPRPRASGAHDGRGWCRRSSNASLIGSTSSEDDMLQGFREKRGTRFGRNRVPAFCRLTAEQMEATPSPIYHEEESSSLRDGLYRDKYSTKNESWIGTEYLSRDPLQLLRQLDELRGQISRSCEVVEGSWEKMPGADRPASSSRSCDAVNIPRERMPVPEVYYKGIQNLDSSLHGSHGCEEQHGPQPPGRAPYLPSAHYAERRRNHYLHRQFDADPLTSYHHDEFNHQPSCPCMYCRHKHMPSPERVSPHSITKESQRHPYFSQNHVSYHVDLQILRMQEHNEKVAKAEISEKKDNHPCQAFAGAAPFVICSVCFELLRLPQMILLVSKKLCKLRCGSCSEMFSIELVGKRLVTSARLPSVPLPEACCSSDVKMNQDVHVKVQSARKSYGSSTEDFSGPCKSMQSIDGGDFSPSTSSHGLMEKESMFNLREADQTKGILLSSDRSDNVETQDCTVRQQAAPSTTVSPFDAASPDQDYLIGPLSNQVKRFEDASMNKRSNKQTTVSYGDKLHRSGDADEVVTEIDLSVKEYASSSLSQDYLETEKDQNQARIDDYNDSLVSKGSLEDYALYSPSIRDERHEVSVNGHPIPDHLVKKAEKQAGRVLPGEYWYDSRAGFWGVMGQPCLGIIPPLIEEFSYPVSKNCASGNTGVLVNGRELHKKDLSLLVSRGLPPTSGQYYVLEFSGKFYDEFTGEELGNIGKLAPTVEKMGRGFGMKVPV